jgi:small GTP-binding protein
MAKVVFVGESGVGKTAIIHAGRNETFGVTQATIGAGEFRINVPVAGTVVKLVVWDTAGQDTYAALVPHYVRGAKACVLTFSLIDDLTLDSIPQWKRLINEQEAIPHLFVVGNKLDLTGQRQVTSEQGQEVAERIGAAYFETSAKTGSGIELLFTEVAKAMDEPQPPSDLTPSVVLAATTPDKRKKKSCCR